MIMWSFLLGILILVVGYFTYGRLVERILMPDDRVPPAKRLYDGVDYLVLPHWKNMLIELLNIAGIGPVIGVILGIKFGPVVFLIIPIGNIIGGAVHDFIGGMMSIRNDGKNIAPMVQKYLGNTGYYLISLFFVIILLLVVTVFINVPASLLDSLVPELKLFWLFVALIFVYYIMATMFSVDKIIGRFYPFFGLMLLIGTAAIFIMLLWHGLANPAEFMTVTDGFKKGMDTSPIIPCLFVTIACGIISGFHATQAPIVARTMESERNARPTYYGMMVLEGVIGMIWAAAAMAIYTLNPNLMAKPAAEVLGIITTHFLGNWMGGITILAVVILAVTSGDTALRCLRTGLGEILNIQQKPLVNRFVISLPLIFLVAILLYWSNQNAQTFKVLWNYFAWGNQILASCVLMCGTAWLIMERKNAIIAIIPGMFMLFIVVCYILWTSTERKGPMGFGMELNTCYIIAAIVTLFLYFLVICRGLSMRSQGVESTSFDNNKIKDNCCENNTEKKAE